MNEVEQCITRSLVCISSLDMSDVQVIFIQILSRDLMLEN